MFSPPPPAAIYLCLTAVCWLGRGAEIVQTDIKASVESIMAPAIPIALRLSGHLLLGVCRIYSRKVVYLYNESNEAMVKTKMVRVRAARPARSDRPPAFMRSAACTPG